MYGDAGYTFKFLDGKPCGILNYTGGVELTNQVANCQSHTGCRCWVKLWGIFAGFTGHEILRLLTQWLANPGATKYEHSVAAYKVKQSVGMKPKPPAGYKP